MSSGKIWGVLSGVLGLALFVACLWLTEFPEFERLRDVDLYWLGLAVLAQGGFALLMPIRWQLVSAGAGVTIPYEPAFRISAYTSLAGALVPQSLADLAGRGPWEAKYTGCGLLNATNIILCDRLLDIYIITLLLLPALAFATGILTLSASMGLALPGLLLGLLLLLLLRGKFFVLFELLFQLLHWCLDRIPFLRGRFNWHVTPIELKLPVLVAVYLISVVKFLIITFATYSYFAAVRLEVGIWLVFLALPVTQFVFIFSFTPGGLGIFELGWTGILAMHGFAASKISLFIISQRVCFTLGVIVWAVIAFVWASLFPQRTDRRKLLKSQDNS